MNLPIPLRVTLIVLDSLVLLWGLSRFADLRDSRRGGRMRVVRRVLSSRQVDPAVKEALLLAAQRSETLPLADFQQCLNDVVDNIPDGWKAENLRWKIHRAFLEESSPEVNAPFPRKLAARYLLTAAAALALLVFLLA